MPLYEYRCPACGRCFEVLQRMGEGNESVSCPSCGASRPERQLSTFAAGSSPRNGGECGAGACGAGSGFT